MKKKVFVIFSLARVRKSEFPEIMKVILDIVEKHNPVTLKIVGMYNLLLELKPLLDMLTVKYDGYPNLKEFVAQRKKRNKLLRAILKQLSAIENAELTSTAPQAALAVPYLRLYLNGITKVNASVKAGRVNQLLFNLKDNVAMTAALSGVGLTVYIDELRIYQQSVNQGDAFRRAIQSVRSDFNGIDAMAQIASAISNLLNVIELARIEHTDLDYMPLINELNVLLISKQSVIRSRNTRSKNSVANKITTVASSTTTTATAI